MLCTAFVLLIAVFGCAPRIAPASDVDDTTAAGATTKTLVGGPEIFSEAQVASQSIALAVAGPFSGDMEKYGRPTYRVVEYATQLLNESGGLLDRPIAFYAFDDGCVSAHGPKASQWLVDQGVRIVVGHICNGINLTARPVYEKNQVLVISPSASDPGLGVRDGLFFRTIPADDAQADLLMGYCLERGWKRVGLLAETTEYGQEQGKYMAGHAAVREGVEVAVHIDLTPDGDENLSLSDELAKSKLDVVIYCGQGDRFERLVRRMRVEGNMTPVIGVEGVEIVNHLDSFSADIRDVYVMGVTDLHQVPMYAAFYEDHLARFGTEPGPFYMEAWAAVSCVTAAMKKADSADPVKIAEALRNNWCDSPLGVISFDDYGNVVGTGFVLRSIENGALVDVAP